MKTFSLAVLGRIQDGVNKLHSDNALNFYLDQTTENSVAKVITFYDEEQKIAAFKGETAGHHTNSRKAEQVVDAGKPSARVARKTSLRFFDENIVREANQFRRTSDYEINRSRLDFKSLALDVPVGK